MEAFNLKRRQVVKVTVEHYQKIHLKLMRNWNSNYRIKIIMDDGKEFIGKVVQITESEEFLFPREELKFPLEIQFETDNQEMIIEVLKITKVDDEID